MRDGSIKFEMYELGSYDPIEIRFDRGTSTFFATFLDKRFSDKDLNELKSKMFKESEAREKTTWVLVIKLSYAWRDDYPGFDFDRKYLGTTTFPDGHKEQVLAHQTKKMHDKDIEKNWYHCGPEDNWNGNSEHYKIIPYSKEKYDTLKLLRDRMIEFKEKVDEIIQGDDCIRFLEHLQNKKNFLQLEYKKKVIKK